jgi:demethylmenaquinone methyltransferase/2-methoxy-6-polyprenyl-1,4-benzoquinol methylase
VAVQQRAQQRLTQVYRRKAKHYDITSRLSPVPGYPEQAQRRRAVRALALRPGATVIDVACGTGRNFAAIEAAIGPRGRIVGVDLTDAMLEQAERRVDRNGWRNVELVQADAAEFHFPAAAHAIVSTYALTQVPEAAEVIARGAAALTPGGRWVVLDLQLPAAAPRSLLRLGASLVRPFASIDEWLARRPWDTIHAAMRAELDDLSWTQLCFGTAFLAVGSRGGVDSSTTRAPRAAGVQPRGDCRATFGASVLDHPA